MKSIRVSEEFHEFLKAKGKGDLKIGCYNIMSAEESKTNLLQILKKIDSIETRLSAISGGTF